jgi:O-antigen polymerase
LILSGCAIFFGLAGLQETLDKTDKLTRDSYSAARVEMYQIGAELVAKEPVTGFGIGGFLKAWNSQASDYIQRKPEARLPNYVKHPHNETLLWLIEGGIAAFLGILCVVFGVIKSMYACGFQRGGAYAAMLFPITLHTQVELPFYHSSLHWFLWLFLIFLALYHQRKFINVKISNASLGLIKLTTVIFVVMITIFLINTIRAQIDLRNFLYDENVKPPYLELALNNLYFKNKAEKAAMSSMLYASIEKNDRDKVSVYEDWANDYIKNKPELDIFEGLISASSFLRPQEKGCDAIAKTYLMYAHNKALKSARDNCITLGLLKP